VVWVADEQRVGWLGTPFDQPLSPGVKISFAEPSQLPEKQAAITSVKWLEEKEGKAAVEVKIRLFTPEKMKRQLQVIDGVTVVAKQEIELQSAVENTFRIPLDFPPGKQPDGIRVQLDADDLPADDTAWLVPTRGDAARVLVSSSTGGADFLTHAIGATHKLADGALEAAPFPRGEWPAKSVAIVRGGDFFTSENSAHLDKFVAAGGPVWIFLDGSPTQAAWLKSHGVQVAERPAASEPWHLQDWDPEHPILAAFAGQSLMPLMDIEFYQGFNMTGESVTAVADWPDGAIAIGELNAGGRRIFICGFPADRTATDWPLKPSFVPFVHQAVHWLSSVASSRADWRVGDTIPLSTEQGTWRAVDSAEPVAEQKISGSVRPAVPGLYEFSSGGKKQLFAVNVPAGESDLAPWTNFSQLAALQSTQPVQFNRARQRAAVHLSDEASESQQHFWWWLLAICSVGMLAELALANRTAM
jgi:hypothetical protein